MHIIGVLAEGHEVSWSSSETPMPETLFSDDYLLFPKLRDDDSSFSKVNSSVDKWNPFFKLFLISVEVSCLLVEVDLMSLKGVTSGLGDFLQVLKRCLIFPIHCFEIARVR
jgi:hypothetical protein